MILGILTIAMLLLLLLRVPVAVSMLFPCLVYVGWSPDISLGVALQQTVGSVDSFPLLAVDSIVNITCGEQSTEQALEAFRLDQYEAHKHLDNHCKATVNKSLPGFKELQLLKLDDAGCLLTITGFWLCSAFLQ